MAAPVMDADHCCCGVDVGKPCQREVPDVICVHSEEAAE